MNRLFVLREQIHFDNMVAFAAANWRAMAGDKPLSAVFAPYRKTRSNEQNALMWVWLGQIERDAWVGGRQYDAETWHEHCKRTFYPELNAKGDDKWKLLPNGDRICIASTTRLNVTEMSEYMTAIEAWAATDLGVTLK